MKLDIEIKNIIQKALYGLAKSTKGSKKLFSSIGSDLTASTVMRIARSKTSPDGVKWKPSKKIGIIGNHKKMVSKPALTLIGDGALKDTITYYVNNTGVVIGTNRPYGKIHQRGGMAGRGGKTKIIALPYLGVSQADKSVIAKHLEQHILEENAKNVR